MEEYKLADLAEMVSSLRYCSRDLNTADQLPKKICTDEFLKQLATCLNGLGIMCGNFDADPSLLAQIADLKQSILKGTADTREGVLHALLETILSGVQNNLGSRKFMYMNAEDAQYWDNIHLFGEGFLTVFPEEAFLEMREAGNCLAVRRGTACVFHCMRVAEYGLRMLARKLKVKLTDKGKRCPIDSAAWEKIITAIRNKIQESHNLPTGPKKAQMLEFYSTAADHCEYMKDIWRNNVSHTRKLYGRRDEVLIAFNRVREFVNLLVNQHSPKILQRKLIKRFGGKEPLNTTWEKW